jgi:hypothetical protein
MIMDDNNNIETITLYNNPDGDIFPEKDLPENARLLRGFEWRGDERIKSKDDIYPADEVELHNAIVLRSKEKYEVEKGKRDIEDTKLQDKISSYEVYDNVFRNHNNRIVVDKNNNMFLVRNYKFRFPENVNSFSEYIKKHPKYKDVVKIDHVLWNWETMPGKMYDGGLFKGNDGVEELEFPKKDYLTLEEIFKLYNDKLIIDKNGTELLVSNGVFKLPENIYSGNILKKNYPKYRKQIRINQVLWDSSTMSKGKYDGGIYNGQ